MKGVTTACNVAFVFETQRTLPQSILTVCISCFSFCAFACPKDITIMHIATNLERAKLSRLHPHFASFPSTPLPPIV